MGHANIPPLAAVKDLGQWAKAWTSVLWEWNNFFIKILKTMVVVKLTREKIKCNIFQ